MFGHRPVHSQHALNAPLKKFSNIGNTIVFLLLEVNLKLVHQVIHIYKLEIAVLAILFLMFKKFMNIFLYMTIFTFLKFNEFYKKCLITN